MKSVTQDESEGTLAQNHGQNQTDHRKISRES